jgi:hypothetical protein
VAAWKVSPKVIPLSIRLYFHFKRLNETLQDENHFSKQDRQSHKAEKRLNELKMGILETLSLSGSVIGKGKLDGYQVRKSFKKHI